MARLDTATLQIIAQEAGVSPTTVSNVLNRNRVGKRSDARRNAERIRAIAGKLAYRPNLAARAMQSKRFNAIGLLASTDHRFSVYGNYLPGLTAACRKHGLHLGVNEVVDEQLTDEDFMPRILREWAVDGLIVAYMYAYPAGLAELLERYRIPAVWINVKRAHDCVYAEDRGGFVEGTRVLLQHGHRRICYINTYEGGHYSMTDRRAGYEAAMCEAGERPRLMYPVLDEAVPLSQLLDDLQAMFRHDDRPTAFITYTADQAMTVYHAALLSGLRVPEDLSIIGTAHRPIDVMGRGLATLVLPPDDIAHRAVDLLTQKIADPEMLLPSAPVPLQIRHIEHSIVPPR